MTNYAIVNKQAEIYDHDKLEFLPIVSGMDIALYSDIDYACYIAKLLCILHDDVISVINADEFFIFREEK